MSLGWRLMSKVAQNKRMTCQGMKLSTRQASTTKRSFKGTKKQSDRGRGQRVTEVRTKISLRKSKCTFCHAIILNSRRKTKKTSMALARKKAS